MSASHTGPQDPDPAPAARSPTGAERQCGTARQCAQHRRLKAIVEGTNVGTWEWNVETGETVFNERWAEMVGYALAELEPVSIGTWLQLVHPDDLAESERALQAHFDGQAPFYDVECRMRHRSGKWIWVRDRGRIVSRTPDGAPEMMFGTHSDITRLKHVEFELRRSHDLLSRSERIANLGTWRLDIERRELTWSDQTYRILGFPPGEGEPTIDRFLARVHPEDRESLEATYTDSLLQGTPGYEVRHRVVRADTGEVRHVEQRCVHERHASGSIVRSTGTIHDITETIAREEALRRSEAESRSLAENSRDIIVRFDLAGNHLYVNPTAAALAGIPAEDHIGRSPRDIGLPEVLARTVDEIIATVASRRVPHQLQVELLGRHLDSQCVPEFGPDGELCSVLCIFRDITDVVAAEEKRRAMERQVLLAQKLESLGTMAGGIAHDFNNLLTALQGNVEMALEDLSGDHPAREALEAALGGAQQAAVLTDQMLAYSGRSTGNLEALDVVELVSQTVDALRAAAPVGVSLRVEAPAVTVRVEGNPMQLRQVVVSLVENAIEAIGDGPGTIRVRVGLADAVTEASSESGSAVAPGWACAFVEVADDGEGMDRHVRQQVFEPFFSTRAQGRGLGMAAVQGIVHGHEGRVFVDSTLGEGSTVTVLLPLTRRGANPDPEPVGNEAAGVVRPLLTGVRAAPVSTDGSGHGWERGS